MSTSSLGFTFVVLCVLLVVVRVVPIFLVVKQKFSLYSQGILGVVFTRPVGYSRPSSAVNDPTLMKQVNSENHTSNKCPNHFSIRFP